MDHGAPRGRPPRLWPLGAGALWCVRRAWKIPQKPIGHHPPRPIINYSSPVIANGVLYAAREDGTVFTAKVDEKFELLGENPMGERIVASPVPAANRLFLRGDKHLFCITGAGNTKRETRNTE